MPWPCRLVDHTPGEDSIWGKKRQIGDMWYCNIDTPRSPDYLANRAPRGLDMLWVELPGGPMCLDRAFPDGSCWTVTGEPPNITVAPSINVIGEFHGWVHNGVITDDCEGRKWRLIGDEWWRDRS